MTTCTPPSFPEPPEVVTPDLARVLVSVRDVVPTVLLEAAESVLTRWAESALRDVRAHPRRRGNGPQRAAARADLEAAEGLREELRRRWPVTGSRGAVVHEADSLPALGPEQWAFVARRLAGWAGTLSELFGAARAVIDETPIDTLPWVRWQRRCRWVEEASRARRDARFQDRIADARDEEIERMERRRPLLRAEAADARAAADRLRGEAAVHEEAVRTLGVEALVVYEVAVEGRLPPQEALRRARGEG